MALRKGKDYLASLADGRVIHLDGERIKDVTADRRLVGAARTVASLLDMQHDDPNTAAMSYTSPLSGEQVGLSHIEPRNKTDLEARRGAIGVWMRATQGMFGRSPDFMNVFVSSMGSAASFFAEGGTQYGSNVRRFCDDVRERDLVMTHVLVNPQVDRSKTVEKQDVDLACRIVRETDAGIVVSGARMVSTLAAYSDEIVVMPSSYIANTLEAKDYAFGFSVPVATPGMSFICRPSVVPQAASIFDYPLSMRLDESDAVVVFKDVLVPWERVFVHRNPALCNRIYPETLVGTHTGQQAAVKALAKTEFMLGLALSLVKSTKIDGFLHVQGMLSEIMLFRETVMSCIVAAEANASATKFGTVVPDQMPMWVIRLGFPRMFHRMQEIIQLLGAGGLVAAPSFAEFSGEAAEAVKQYLQSSGQDAEDRVRLCRLAFDASVSSFAGRQQLYERYYTGDPVRLAGTLVNLYPDKDAFTGRVDSLIAGLTGPAAATNERALASKSAELEALHEVRRALA
ncbi:4-hydroxyphenylacetate 3-monooxygenase [Bradyrhizobium sp. GM24.11]